MFGISLLHSIGILNIYALVGPNVHLAALAGCGAGNGSVDSSVTSAVNNIVGALTAIGGAICALGIAIGGLMRATSFGSERRISESNTAITCAVVGLVTVLLAQGLGNWITHIVPATCGVAPFLHLLVMH